MEEVQEEIHIAGILVQVRPEYAAAVSRQVAAMPNAEVCAQAESGKLVVVCESEGADAMLALLAAIRELPGVANVALVYQHAESRSAMEEEISDEADPTRVL
ncbi:glutamate synthase [Azoarcus sp. TTM-91]|jgi:periplasmic nitrate reductase NapD|uniref:chaperone NapD n=1 Tax=Azoarcus sp. TTM-91 TaxID=2691581 RepID=UPI00145EC3B0|nr:chaperone NapD [Azoarcus sp. TTM-91]NMG37126.1 glutamate synthase [Azoarcus sp. TTM-91]